MKRVAFVSDGWGFGTTTLLATVSALLEGVALRRLVGSAKVLDIVWQAFDEARAVDPTDEAALDAALDEVDVVVSCMSVPATVAAGRRDIPTVYVDGLAWMWDGPYGGTSRSGHALEPGQTVVRYFVERFPNIERHLAEWCAPMPPTEVVGPIIDEIEERRREENLLLVNYGGMDSWLMPHDVLDHYVNLTYDLVADAVTRTRDLRLLVVGGAAAMACLRSRRTDDRASFVSLTHDQYVSAVASATLVVTAAGLRAVYECIASGVPTAFLLPQNLSQELTIRQLSKSSAHAGALSWGEIYGLDDLGAILQPLACAAINESILRASGDTATRRRVEDGLVAFLEDPEAAAAAQRDFLDALGPRGGPRVAAYVAELAGG